MPKCPKCGKEANQDPKMPGRFICYDCRVRFSEPKSDSQKSITEPSETSSEHHHRRDWFGTGSTGAKLGHEDKDESSGDDALPDAGENKDSPLHSPSDEPLQEALFGGLAADIDDDFENGTLDSLFGNNEGNSIQPTSPNDEKNDFADDFSEDFDDIFSDFETDFESPATHSIFDDDFEASSTADDFEVDTFGTTGENGIFDDDFETSGTGTIFDDDYFEPSETTSIFDDDFGISETTSIFDDDFETSGAANISDTAVSATPETTDVFAESFEITESPSPFGDGNIGADAATDVFDDDYFGLYEDDFAEFAPSQKAEDGLFPKAASDDEYDEYGGNTDFASASTPASVATISPTNDNGYDDYDEFEDEPDWPQAQISPDNTSIRTATQDFPGFGDSQGHGFSAQPIGTKQEPPLSVWQDSPIQEPERPSHVFNPYTSNPSLLGISGFGLPPQSYDLPENVFAPEVEPTPKTGFQDDFDDDFGDGLDVFTATSPTLAAWDRPSPAIPSQNGRPEQGGQAPQPIEQPALFNEGSPSAYHDPLEDFDDFAKHYEAAPTADIFESQPPQSHGTPTDTPLIQPISPMPETHDVPAQKPIPIIDGADSASMPGNASSQPPRKEPVTQVAAPSGAIRQESPFEAGLRTAPDEPETEPVAPLEGENGEPFPSRDASATKHRHTAGAAANATRPAMPFDKSGNGMRTAAQTTMSPTRADEKGVSTDTETPTQPASAPRSKAPETVTTPEPQMASMARNPELPDDTAVVQLPASASVKQAYVLVPADIVDPENMPDALSRARQRASVIMSDGESTIYPPSQKKEEEPQTNKQGKILFGGASSRKDDKPAHIDTSALDALDAGNSAAQDPTLDYLKNYNPLVVGAGNKLNDGSGPSRPQAQYTPRPGFDEPTPAFQVGQPIRLHSDLDDAFAGNPPKGTAVAALVFAILALIATRAPFQLVSIFAPLALGGLSALFVAIALVKILRKRGGGLVLALIAIAISGAAVFLTISSGGNAQQNAPDRYTFTDPKTGMTDQQAIARYTMSSMALSSAPHSQSGLHGYFNSDMTYVNDVFEIQIDDDNAAYVIQQGSNGADVTTDNQPEIDGYSVMLRGEVDESVSGQYETADEYLNARKENLPGGNIHSIDAGGIHTQALVYEGYGDYDYVAILSKVVDNQVFVLTMAATGTDFDTASDIFNCVKMF